MNSPVYPEVRLQFAEIEPGLKAYRCPRSGGVWIPLDFYLEWQRKQATVAELPSVAPVLDDDSKQPIRICPESGRLLLRYRVGHGLQFRVDQSPATGGIWLDAGEWEALKAKGLHTALNMIFTAGYQRNLREAEYMETVEKVFREKIGVDFERVVEFKRWAAAHPERANILRYLAH